MSAADRLAAAMQDSIGERRPIESPDDLPPALASWAALTQIAETCGHDLSDQVLVGLLGAPGSVYCPACARALLDAHQALQGFTCDGCGQPAHGSITWRAAPRLLVVGALCKPCATPEDHPDTPTDERTTP